MWWICVCFLTKKKITDTYEVDALFMEGVGEQKRDISFHP